jgi:hypothetical protein
LKKALSSGRKIAEGAGVSGKAQRFLTKGKKYGNFYKSTRSAKFLKAQEKIVRIFPQSAGRAKVFSKP